MKSRWHGLKLSIAIFGSIYMLYFVFMHPMMALKILAGIVTMALIAWGSLAYIGGARTKQQGYGKRE